MTYYTFLKFVMFFTSVAVLLVSLIAVWFEPLFFLKAGFLSGLVVYLLYPEFILVKDTD